MGDSIPNITLTNPFNKDQAPSPAQSPVKDGINSYRYSDVNMVGGNGVAGARPVTPGNNRGRLGAVVFKHARTTRSMYID